MYESLCTIIPGLQNHLLASELDDSILHIADLARLIIYVLEVDNYTNSMSIPDPERRF